MHCGLRALLSGIVDYAGLFPPAKLELDPAIGNYARYRSDPDAWMLSNFICPAARLYELSPYVKKLFSAESPLQVSLICGGGDHLDEYEAQLREHIFKLDGFLRGTSPTKTAPRATVAAFETRVPAAFAAIASDEDLLAFLVDVGTIFRGVDLEDTPTYVELPPLENGRRGLDNACAALRDYRLTTGRPVGLKLRCGGLEAGAVPTCERVATAIAVCRDSGVPLKFTAGLHHPVRRVDAGLQCYIHGFLNVFIAGVLADALHLEYHDILAIVEEEDVRQFRFDDDGLSWATARANLGEIEAARRLNVISFGSCSFDEPREDLRALKML